MSRFRAFESEGQCRECRWVGGLDAGLCILCQNLPEVTDEPATVLGDIPLLGKWCTNCGAEHTQHREFCGPCGYQIDKESA